MTELVGEIHNSILVIAQNNGIAVWPASTKVLTNHCVELLYNASTDKPRWIYLTMGPHINLSYNTPYHGREYQPPYELSEKKKLVNDVVKIMGQARV